MQRVSWLSSRAVSRRKVMQTVSGGKVIAVSGRKVNADSFRKVNADSFSKEGKCRQFQEGR